MAIILYAMNEENMCTNRCMFQLHKYSWRWEKGEKSFQIRNERKKKRVENEKARQKVNLLPLKMIIFVHECVRATRCANTATDEAAMPANVWHGDQRIYEYDYLSEH